MKMTRKSFWCRYKLWDITVGYVLLLSWILTVHLVSSQLMVNVAGGQLLGKWTTFANRSVASFLGVPYAHAPILDRRFRNPTGDVKWPGIRNATELSSICLQNGDYLNPLNLEMSEDCLYLNVYVPEIRQTNLNRSPNFTVVVYFHPGAFRSGSGSMLDGTVIALDHDVIVVTVNFRLGVFGFLSLDKTYPGNYGLYDQIAALQWVKYNIQVFGGNPNNIVLICDHFTARLHMFSSFNGLFHRVLSYKEDQLSLVTDIGRSQEFISHSNYHEHCQSYLNHLNQSDVIDVNKCLKTMDAELLLKMSNSRAFSWQINAFGPVVDGVFLQDSPRHSLQEKQYQQVDYMIIDLNHDLNLYRTIHNLSTSSPSHIKNCKHSTLKNITQLISKSKTLSVPLTQTREDYVQITLESFYFPSTTTAPDAFCVTLKQLFTDFFLSEMMAFTDVYSATRFTFLAVASDNNGVDKSSKPRDFHCVLQPANCTTVFHNFNTLIKSFFTYGYPHVTSGDPWRPYTKSNGNFLLLGNATLTTGDKRIWPFRKQDMIWRNLLPRLRAHDVLNEDQLQKTYDRHLTARNYAETEWGMEESQLEALMLSLILVVLFLLIVALALFRIICHVKGKRFYDTKSLSKTTTKLNGSTQMKRTRNIQEQFTESSGVSSISEF